MLCPDRSYHHLQTAAQAVPVLAPILPQLDGHTDEEESRVREENRKNDNWINPNPVIGLWIGICCEYAHGFMMKDVLRYRHNKLIF